MCRLRGDPLLQQFSGDFSDLTNVEEYTLVKKVGGNCAFRVDVKAARYKEGELVYPKTLEYVMGDCRVKWDKDCDISVRRST